MVKNINGELCGPQFTSQGLAQGSPVSLLLFNIYTTSRHKLTTHDTFMIQYADDVVIFFYGNNLPQITSFIKEHLNKMDPIPPLSSKLQMHHQITLRLW